LAYLSGANVSLIHTTLPELGFDVLKRIWRPELRDENARRLLERCGLVGAGPWRVLVPGYVFHALRAGRTALPYSPRVEDVDFA